MPRFCSRGLESKNNQKSVFFFAELYEVTVKLTLDFLDIKSQLFIISSFLNIYVKFLA